MNTPKENYGVSFSVRSQRNKVIDRQGFELIGFKRFITDYLNERYNNGSSLNISEFGSYNTHDGIRDGLTITTPDRRVLAKVVRDIKRLDISTTFTFPHIR